MRRFSVLLLTCVVALPVAAQKKSVRISGLPAQQQAAEQQAAAQLRAEQRLAKRRLAARRRAEIARKRAAQRAEQRWLRAERLARRRAELAKRRAAQQKIRDARNYRRLKLPGDQVTHAVQKLETLEWQDDLGVAQELAKKSKRPIVWIQTLGERTGVL